jgi:8-oxo-dGTP pyrophosphatase MutT (NUDIX family)
VAAVAILLLETPSTLEVLLIERSVRESDPWSGHMALPGGHFEADDRDLQTTAQRETREEVGIELDERAELLGTLADRSPAKSLGPVIRPFVYWTTRQPELQLSSEVTSALWTPLEPLARGERRAQFAFRGATFPAWDVAGKIVWGLTYRVLQDLLAALGLDNPAEPR